MATKDNERSEFLDALRKGVLLGAGILVLVLPPMWLAKRQPERAAPPPAVVHAPAAPAVPSAPPPNDASPRLAEFGGEVPAADVRLVANWAAHTRDHKNNAFVIVDKKQARLYVFGPDAKLRSATPILLGKAIGDHTVPGIGDKPLSQVKEEEKTTPAGRFIAEPGRNTKGEDIIWVDYDAAVSMHRLRLVSKEERRAQRLASPTVEDNRISFGCINVPVAFYEGVLSPTVHKEGAVIYVMPETQTPQQLFGAWDVEHGARAQLAKVPATPAPVIQTPKS